MSRPKEETPIRPSLKKEMMRPTWDENWEEHLIQSLFDEQPENKEDENLENIYISEKFCHKERPGEEWDVPLTEEIQYFDPELSYELTGYRPITMTKGLDFDYHEFTKVGEIYDRTGKYTEYPINSMPYKRFWDAEFEKCKNGCTIGKYRLTGDYYFFLNFYRMPKVPDDETLAVAAGRSEGFPDFAAKQYEFCHYVEMCEKLRKDVCILKGRATGLSELVANFAVRPYTTNRNYRTLLTCEADGKLAPLKSKCWKQLNWLDLNTNGGMKHLRQKYNSDDKKRASQVTKDGEEFGWLSEIEAVVADNPDKIRGDRCDRLIYEEAGSSKKLIKAWIQGTSLTELGGRKIGLKIALGTGGDEVSLEGLTDLFSNPTAYNILPYKNYDTEDDKPELTAFFLPSHKFSLLKEYVDSRGVTDHIRFKEFYKKQRAKLTDRALMDECAEHCFTPREALIKHGNNLFDPEPLSHRLMQLKVQNLGIKPKRMQLLWDKTAGNGMQQVKAVESANSKLLVIEPPMVDTETGHPYKNLYVAGIDSIDMGTSDSATDYDVSDFCIVIKKRVFGMDEPKYVAIYKDRPSNIRVAYDLAMKLLTWYNCKAILEYTKISIIQYFTERHKESLFMDRPEWAVGASVGKKRVSKKRLIGISSAPAVINHGLELISNFIADYCDTFDLEEMVEQLLNYTLESKRKFDIVAAMQCAEIADEALSGIAPSSVKSVSSQWRDIGWYINENGYKQYGVLPKKQW